MCLPCFAGTALFGWRLNRGVKSVSKAFSRAPDPAAPPPEPAFVTELALKYRIASLKPTRGADPAAASGSRSLPRAQSKKDAASRARLQELIDKHGSASRAQR